MKKQSAGILLYRHGKGGIEVLLVHPGGPFHKNKDIGNWSIPKGEFDDNEEALIAAKREFEEELGQKLQADKFIEMTPVKQRSGKIVHAWAAKGDFDAAKVRSNIFRLEYPYKSGKWIDVPEVDKAEWFAIEEAKKKINVGQAPLIDELLQLINENKA